MCFLLVHIIDGATTNPSLLPMDHGLNDRKLYVSVLAGIPSVTDWENNGRMEKVDIYDGRGSNGWHGGARKQRQCWEPALLWTRERFKGWCINGLANSDTLMPVKGKKASAQQVLSLRHHCRLLWRNQSHPRFVSYSAIQNEDIWPQKSKIPTQLQCLGYPSVIARLCEHCLCNLAMHRPTTLNPVQRLRLGDCTRHPPARSYPVWVRTAPPSLLHMLRALSHKLVKRNWSGQFRRFT